MQFRTKGSTKKPNIRPPQAKCIRTDRHTDSQKQGDHWQSERGGVGDTEIKTQLYEEEGNRRREKSQRGIEIFEKEKSLKV